MSRIALRLVLLVLAWTCTAGYAAPPVFVSQQSVPVSTAVVSNAAVISGLATSASISVADGEYSIACATFTTGAGTIANGQVLCLRHVSAATPSTIRVTTVTIDGAESTFQSTTEPVDTTPDQFYFSDVTNVAPGSSVVSLPITVNGINAPAPIAVSQGEYSIGCSGTFATTPSQVAKGDLVCVRHAASSSYNGVANTTLTIGVVSDTFTSLTRAQVDPNVLSEALQRIPGREWAVKLVRHPADPLRIFALTMFDLYESRDEGITWTRKIGPFSYENATDSYDASNTFCGYLSGYPGQSGGQPSYCDVVFDTTTLPNTIYVASRFRGRVHRSTDDGATWQSLQYNPPGPLVAFGVHPTNPQILIAAYAPSGYSNDYVSFQISTNRGGSWANVPLSVVIPGTTNPAQPYDGAWSEILFAPAVDNVFYYLDRYFAQLWKIVIGVSAPTQIPQAVQAPDNAPSAKDLLGGSGDRSTDFGATWSPSVWNGPSLAPLGTFWMYSSVIAVNDSTGREALFGRGASLAETLDGGASWITQSIPNSGLLQFLLDPTDRVQLLATSTGIYRKATGEPQWKNVSFGLRPQKINSIFASRANPDVVLIGTEQAGVFISSDAGSSWTQRNSGLPTTSDGVIPAVNPIKSGCFDTQSDLLGYVVAGSASFRSVDRGAAWTPMSPPITVNKAVYCPRDQPATVYVSGSGGLNTLVRSDNAGLTWTNVTGLNGAAVNAVIAAPGSTDLFVAAGDGVYRSNGQSAVAKTNPSVFSRIAVSPATPRRLYAVNDSNRIATSDDLGVTWNVVLGFPGDISGGAPWSGSEITALATHPTENGILFVSTKTKGIHVSFTDGSSWLQVGTSSASQAVETLDLLFGGIPQSSASSAKSLQAPPLLLLAGSADGTTSRLVLRSDAPVQTGTLITRYRLYSPTTLEHLYTTNLFEYQYLSNQLVRSCCGWNAEGATDRVFDGPGSLDGVAAVPYYRLYNPASYQHHWTSDANEYAFLPSVGWQAEGIAGYILPSPAAGSVPLYRLYISVFGGLHIWTRDVNERNYLVGSQGWVDEGIAGYVLPPP